MFRFVRRLRGDRSGATAIEYALVASLIAVVLIGAVATLGQTIKGTLYGQIAAAMP